jgi:type I restriction enzyme M protein
MKDRVLRDVAPGDIAKITGTLRVWKKGTGYEDISGYCKAAKIEDIQKHDFVLTPGRYVGAPRLKRVTEIRNSLAGLGYEL